LASGRAATEITPPAGLPHLVYPGQARQSDRLPGVPPVSGTARHLKADRDGEEATVEVAHEALQQ
jgi:hypothetical protein